MMFTIPGLDKGVDEDQAPLEAIRQINDMVHSLVNKVSLLKFGPWSGIITRMNSGKLRTEIPEALDFAEKYIYI